jgi:hypothetical protein
LKQLLIYERPVSLDRARHRDMRIPARLDGFGFARALNSVPLVGGEFAAAARDYPIVFAGTDTTSLMPAALLGLFRDDNLFVQADGSWAEQTYVPAFLRRYPFVVAGEGDDTRDFMVCIDEAFADAAVDGASVRLFDEHGGDSPALQQAVSFLAEYQNEVLRTRAFMAELVEHQLLIPRTVKVERPASEPHTLHGFHVVDEQKLHKLRGKALEKLERQGSLALIYAHLWSLTNVQRLTSRLDGRGARH